MNEIKLSGVKKVMKKSIPVIEGGFGDDCKAILAKTIAEMHDIEVKRINELISNNRKRFRDNIDIIDLKQVADDDLFLRLGFSKAQWGNSKHVYLLSERGYAKVIKIMDSDRAWEIHDELIDEYFSMRKQLDQIAIQHPFAYFDTLPLTRHSLSITLTERIDYTNVKKASEILLNRIIASKLSAPEKEERITWLATGLGKARNNTLDLAERYIFSECIERAKSSQYLICNKEKGGLKSSYNKKLKKYESKINTLEEEMKKTKEELLNSVLSEEDKKSLHKYRKYIVSNILVYSCKNDIGQNEAFHELYDWYFEIHGVEISIEYSGSTSYLQCIEDRGDLDVMRNLYAISKSMVKE